MKTGLGCSVDFILILISSRSDLAVDFYEPVVVCDHLLVCTELHCAVFEH